MSGEITAIVGNVVKSSGVKNALVMVFVFQTATSAVLKSKEKAKQIILEIESWVFSYTS